MLLLGHSAPGACIVPACDSSPEGLQGSMLPSHLLGQLGHPRIEGHHASAEVHILLARLPKRGRLRLGISHCILHTLLHGLLHCRHLALQERQLAQ